MRNSPPEESRIESQQLKLIEQAAAIIATQVVKIGELGNRETGETVESEQRVEVLETVHRYSDLFSHTVQFLRQKMETEPTRQIRLYLPSVRTLLEIYARLLYITSQPLTRQALLCIAGDFCTLATFARLKPDNTELVDVYMRGLTIHKRILQTANLTLPERPESLSWDYFREKGFTLPSVIKMLNEAAVRSTAPRMLSRFPTIAIGPERFYVYLSNYVHGNPLFATPHGNEKLWIISKLITISGQFIELLETRLFANAHSKEFEEWLTDLDAQRSTFLEYWKQKRKQRAA